jgi:release factor glutamine methyltransferase
LNLTQVLSQARSVLQAKQIEQPSLESEILLRHVLGMRRAELFSRLDEELDEEKQQVFDKILQRRISGEPSAYITGLKEFYGLEFFIDRQVLIPRPETELLVEKSITLARQSKIKNIADIGTGCGAIAVSLGVNLPEIKIYATDISAAALNIAKQNSIRHNVEEKINFLQGRLLAPLPFRMDLIIANLPYVKTSDIPEEGPLSYEPRVALNGGEDGLDYFKLTIKQAGKKLNRVGCLLLEVGQGQADAVGALIGEEFPDSAINIYRDLAGIERIVVLCLT